MSLRVQAAADARMILENAAGFAWPITVTNPNGVAVTLLGLCKDISQRIDPETGIVVAAREASATLPIAALYAAGIGLPKAVPENSARPWVVEFYDHAGILHVFKVSESRPDQTLGVIVCMLEAYKR